ncbi:MAG: hypothetical protein GY805_26800 [Chloroflexi bacterium]|nr:hypothetical protein [Chloroflexota bacterium]
MMWLWGNGRFACKFACCGGGETAVLFYNPFNFKHLSSHPKLDANVIDDGRSHLL